MCTAHGATLCCALLGWAWLACGASGKTVGWLNVTMMDSGTHLHPNIEQVQNTLHQLKAGTIEVDTRPRPSTDGTWNRKLAQPAAEEPFLISWIPPESGEQLGNNPWANAIVRTTVLPAIDSLVGRSLRVRKRPPPPDQEVLDYVYLSNTGLDDLPPSKDNAVLQEQDMLLQVYFYSNGEEPCGTSSGTLAAAGPFIFEKETLRPVFGGILLCPNILSLDSEIEVVETLLHEVIHALGFVPYMFPTFDPADDGGEPLTKQGGKTYVTTPNVRKFVQNHFDCPDLIGAALESAGGEGTAGGHWENTYYHGVMMQGAVKSDGHVNRIVMTDLTLALFQDSGWYDVMYHSAGFDPYGYKAGCALVTGTFEEALNDDGAAPFLCTPDQQCDFRAGDEYCSTQSTAPRQVCLTEFLEACSMCTFDHSGSGLCANFYTGEATLKVEKVLELAGSEDCQADAGKRCYMDDSVSANRTSCVSMACSASNDEILINGKPCEGDMCPDVVQMCEDPGLLLCMDGLNDCNGKGDCFRGHCMCHTGWGGVDCSIPVCKGTCADGTPCPPSGFCDVPTCGEFSSGKDDAGKPCFMDARDLFR